MTWNNPYLTTPRGTTQPSGRTTTLSDLSSAGTLYANSLILTGPLQSPSTGSFGGGTFTTGTFTGAVNMQSTASVRTRLDLGGASTGLVFVSGSSTTVVAITVTATKSESTTFTDNNCQLGDIIVGSVNTLVGGVTYDLVCSTASTIHIRYSNVSAANASQPAVNLRYAILRTNG